MLRLSGTVSEESSVKDTIRQGLKGRGAEEWMDGGGEGREKKEKEHERMCWRGKKETRLRKSAKSVGEVLKPFKQNAQKCSVARFFNQIREWSEGG